LLQTAVPCLSTMSAHHDELGNNPRAPIVDIHKESISIAFSNDAGKIVIECVIQTRATMILQFIDGLRLLWSACLLAFG
jgi:hypothetical protein